MVIVLIKLLYCSMVIYVVGSWRVYYGFINWYLILFLYILNLSELEKV